MADTKKIIKKLIFPFAFSIGFASLNMFYSNPRSIIIFIFYFMICFIPASLIYVYKEKIFKKSNELIIDKKDDMLFFFNCFIVLFIVGIIYLMLFYPGIVDYDFWESSIQLSKGEHSVAPVTFIYISNSFWQLNNGISPYGFLLYFIAQIILYSISISFMLLFLHRMRIRKGLERLILIFLAFHPLILVQVITSTKDMLFTPFFVIFITCISYYLYDKSFFNKATSKILLFIAILFIVLIRNNGLLIIIVSLPLILYLFRKNGAMILFYVGSFIMVLLISNFLPSLVGIKDKQFVEALSVPIQGIARVYNNENNNLSWNEKERIKELIPNVELYNQYISDILKKNVNPFRHIELIQLWAQYCMSYPIEILDAFLLNNQGYFYMFDNSIGHLYGHGAYFNTISCKEAQLEEKSWFPQLRIIFFEYLDCFKYDNATFLQLVLNLYLFVYTFLFFDIQLFKKKEKDKIMVALIPMIYFFTLLLGPCVLVRYMIPIITIIPLIAFLGIDDKKSIAK